VRVKTSYLIPTVIKVAPRERFEPPKFKDHWFSRHLLHSSDDVIYCVNPGESEMPNLKTPNRFMKFLYSIGLGPLVGRIVLLLTTTGRKTGLLRVTPLQYEEVDGVYYIIDIRRLRGAPPEVEAAIKQTAMLDGRRTRIYMEQEPGSSGVNTVDYYARKVLKGFSFWGIRSTGPKEERAAPVSSAAEAGNVRLVNGRWINDFLDEFEAFPLGSHDDQVDAVSGAFEQLRGRKTDKSWVLI